MRRSGRAAFRCHFPAPERDPDEFRTSSRDATQDPAEPRWNPGQERRLALQIDEAPFAECVSLELERRLLEDPGMKEKVIVEKDPITAHERAAAEIAELRRKGIPCHLEEPGADVVEVVRDRKTAEQDEQASK